MAHACIAEVQPVGTAGLVLNAVQAGTGKKSSGRQSIFLSLWIVLSPKALLYLKARKLTSCCCEESLNEQDRINRLLWVCIVVIFMK